MSIARRLSLIAVSVLMSVLFVTGDLTTLSAQEDQQQELGSGLSISPTRFDLSVDPGGTDTIRISVKNVTNARVIAVPIINDFASDNDTGTPRIIINDDREDLPSIKPFFSDLESLPIEPGETVTTEIPLSLPADTPAGGYYGVLRFVATPDGELESEDPSQVALTASLASVVLVEVPGDITEQIQLRNILFYRKDVAGTFFTSAPEQIGVQILNQGNGFSRPFGTVSVKNPLGKEVLNYELNSTNPRGNVLPDSSRTFKDSLPGVSVPGRYVATADVSFGNGGEVLRTTRTFWYLPYWFLAVVVVVLAALVYLGVLLRRKIATGNFKRKK